LASGYGLKANFIIINAVLIPQTPGQGSSHLFRLQALLDGQSWLSTHSGRQPMYGSPKYSGIHTQEPAPSLTRHSNQTVKIIGFLLYS